MPKGQVFDKVPKAWFNKERPRSIPLKQRHLGPFITNNDLNTSKIFLNKSKWATWNGSTGKYTFYGMHLLASTHSTECASWQVHILQNVPTGKYTFYGMRLRANIHSTKCAYGQIYAFYGMRLQAECTYGQNVAKSILFVRNQYKCRI